MSGVLDASAQPGQDAKRGLTTTEIKANMTSGGNAAYHNFNNDFAHISDVNERRRLALAEIDKAPFGWYHVRAIMVAGIGFFTDSYDIFAVGLVTSLLGIVYFNGAIPSKYDTAIKVGTSAGTVVGQVGFGALADLLGRKKMYGFELILIIFTTLAQSLSSNSPSMSIVGLLVFWRVLMGIGIGGDYPLSAIITSEFATTKWRGFMMNAVFAMQGFGQLAAGIMLLIVTAAFKDSLELAAKPAACSTIPGCIAASDRMWRILIGFGAVPGCIALYFRLTIPETPRYTFDVEQDAEKAIADVDTYRNGHWGDGQVDDIARVQSRIEARAELEVPKASWSDFGKHYRQWKNLKVLLGCALSWFFLDIAFYGLGLNNAIILNAIGWSGGKNVYQIYYNTAVGNLILVLAGAVPGYWVSACIMTRLAASQSSSSASSLSPSSSASSASTSGISPVPLSWLSTPSPSSSSTLAPTAPHSSFPENASRPAIAPPRTASAPPRARLVPSSLRSSSARSRPSVPTRSRPRLTRAGPTLSSLTSCRSSLCSC